MRNLVKRDYSVVVARKVRLNISFSCNCYNIVWGKIDRFQFYLLGFRTNIEAGISQRVVSRDLRAGKDSLRRFSTG